MQKSIKEIQSKYLELKVIVDGPKKEIDTEVTFRLNAHLVNPVFLVAGVRQLQIAVIADLRPEHPILHAIESAE